MSTGVESWNTNLLELGPVYPFVGTEMILVVVGVAAWLGWHFLQARVESQEIERESKYEDPNLLRRAMENDE